MQRMGGVGIEGGRKSIHIAINLPPPPSSYPKEH